VQSSSQNVTTNKPTPSFLQAGCPSCHPTNSVKALKGKPNAYRLEIGCLNRSRVRYDRTAKVKSCAKHYRWKDRKSYRTKHSDVVCEKDWPSSSSPSIIDRDHVLLTVLVPGGLLRGVDPINNQVVSKRVDKNTNGITGV